MKKIGFKYQAQIRHRNGDIITTIWDNNKQSFLHEIQKWKRENINSDLFIEVV